jgi:hypothetical protein
MSLLNEIQVSLLDDNAKIGPILLKLRFLASRLGVPILEDWVKHEVEGYPDDAVVPDYRKAGVTFTGMFQNMFQVMADVPIPAYLIKKHAGEHWNTITLRDSISVIDDRIARAQGREKGGTFGINAGNLILLLQGKIFEDTGIIRIDGKFDISAFVTIQAAVRAKLLDLTLAIEKAVPAAADIVVGTKPAPLAPADAEKVAQVAQQVFFGPVTNITNSGTSGPIIVNSAAGDIGELIKALTQVGVSENNAKELAGIVASEQPEDAKAPLGKSAKAWIAKAAKAAGGVAGKVGVPVAIDVIEAAIKSLRPLIIRAAPRQYARQLILSCEQQMPRAR